MVCKVSGRENMDIHKLLVIINFGKLFLCMQKYRSRSLKPNYIINNLLVFRSKLPFISFFSFLEDVNLALNFPPIQLISYIQLDKLWYCKRHTHTSDSNKLVVFLDNFYVLIFCEQSIRANIDFIPFRPSTRLR